MKERLEIVLRALEMVSVSGRRNIELMCTVLQTLELTLNELERGSNEQEVETDVSDQR